MSTELREAHFWILSALAGGRSHGYALLQDVSASTGGRVQLKVATLYAALERLSSEGLVAADGDEAVNGRLRRYFRLTSTGAEALQLEVERLEANARHARARLQQRPAVTA